MAIGIFEKPTIEITQSRYEELIKNEQKYEQYKALADEKTKIIIEVKEKEKITFYNDGKEIDKLENESEEN